MMILIPFILSVDSLFASFVLGASRVERSRQMNLAVAFGVCDGAASLFRGAFDLPARNTWWVTSHLFQLAVGFYLIVICLAWLFEAVKALRTPLLWTVPVVLSIDNLVGPNVEPFSFSSVVLAAFASVSMSLVGFRLGTFLADICRNVTSLTFFRRSTP